MMRLNQTKKNKTCCFDCHPNDKVDKKKCLFNKSSDFKYNKTLNAFHEQSMSI